MLLYGSLFGKNTGIVTGILYAISIGIGILIPIVQGKVNKNKPFWIAIRNIAAIFTTCSISVLIVLRRVLEEHMAEDSCRKQCQLRQEESLCGE